MNLIERHQAFLASRGISPAQIAKAYGYRLPAKLKVDAQLKQWVIQARNAAILADIIWNIPF